MSARTVTAGSDLAFLVCSPDLTLFHRLALGPVSRSKEVEKLLLGLSAGFQYLAW